MAGIIPGGNSSRQASRLTRVRPAQPSRARFRVISVPRTTYSWEDSSKQALVRALKTDCDLIATSVNFDRTFAQAKLVGYYLIRLRYAGGVRLERANPQPITLSSCP